MIEYDGISAYVNEKILEKMNSEDITVQLEGMLFWKRLTLNGVNSISVN